MKKKVLWGEKKTRWYPIRLHTIKIIIYSNNNSLLVDKQERKWKKGEGENYDFLSVYLFKAKNTEWKWKIAKSKTEINPPQSILYFLYKNY